MNNIIFGTGKEWSKISLETEKIFSSWLEASNFSSALFFEKLNNDSFEILWNIENKEVMFIDEHGGIGIPFVYHEEYYENFLMDLSILLLYISYRCSDNRVSEKIKIFVKRVLKKNNYLKKYIENKAVKYYN